ncbi:MAG: glycosyltransferase [Trichlorobacter sp.]|uniref:CgeB family protein n=1 Tax=Trichlorobacter sp. TaxID=2911007 RepID=UPI002563B797|nr:glycosyltransferase [Trichlorobacter sp.]MDK9717042.1 glycosyltransferase [Trichlorobacter sp.]
MIAGDKKALVWLAYVAYPVTSAAYLERALRRICRCVTLGPSLPEHYIDHWMLQNMKLPIRPHDIPTVFTPDVGQLYGGTPEDQRPDLFLFVESVGGFTPQGLERLRCPKACYLIDNHVSLNAHLEWAKHYDYVFIAQRAYLDQFRQVNTNSYWLPVGCDPEVHYGYPALKQYDVAFAGGILEGSRRWNILNQLSANLNLGYDRLFWDDMAWLFSSAKIILNNAFKDDLNMRCFEALSIGSMMLADMAHDSGQDELFVAGEEYALYTDDTILDVARYYLEHDALREKVAKKGRKIVHAAHTYAHRVEDLLAVVLRGKPDTWSAGQLRLRSEGMCPSDGTPYRTDTSAWLTSAEGAYRLPARLRGVGHYPGVTLPIFQYFNEQATVFAELLGAELKTTDFHCADLSYGSHEFNLVFVTMVSQLRKYRGNYQLIVVINDVWPHEFDEFAELVQDLPLVYVTNSEICNRLQQRGLSMVRFMPCSVPEAYIPKQVPVKDIDIIHYGRQNPVLYGFMEQLISRFPDLHYLTTEIDPQSRAVYFVSNKYGVLGRSDDRPMFMQMLARCKISLVSSPGYDGERDLGCCGTVAIRYFESASQFCHMIGRHPDTEDFRSLGVDSVCSRVSDYADFEAVVLDCLSKPFSKEKEAVYRNFLSLNSTEQRVVGLVNDLDSLNGLRR